MKIEITNAKEMKLSDENICAKPSENRGVVVTDCDERGYGTAIDCIVKILSENGIVADIKLIGGKNESKNNKRN